MYSSVLGGIVTNPAFMVLPLDDHMVHRGHAVFDTATLTGGMLYQLDPHLDRLMRSAEGARIPLPFPRERLRQIILETAAASRRREASVRYWLSAGPGGFALGPAECVGSSFYVIIFKPEAYPESYYTQQASSSSPARCRLSRRSSPASSRPIILPNVLVVLEAKDRGADNGVFIDQRGNVAESSNMNIAFVTRTGCFATRLSTRSFRASPSSACSSSPNGFVTQGALRAVRLADIPVAEGRGAAEMMLIGSSIKIAPVVEWDGQKIGDGKPGPIAMKLLEMWNEDASSSTDQLIAVPFDEGV
jgi:4-amino-4-deoxychorismate lyase